MRGNRSLIVASALLLSAGLVSTLAIAASDDHAKTTAAPAKTTTHVESTSKPTSKSTTTTTSTKATTTKSTTEKSAESETSTKSTSKSSTEQPETKSISEDVPTTPDAAIEALKAGNERWVSGKTKSPNTSSERRESTAANGQKPFATIYTCADSRLPVERMFDQGVGDVFVLRIAGNVIGAHETGTIEYGVEHLHTPVLVVMGHTQCGAVTAACSNVHASESVESLLKEIKPAIDRARLLHPEATDAKLVEYAVNENVWESVFQLFRNSETVRTLVQEGKVKVVGAVCNISTGKVDFLGEHPWQSQLLQAMAATESNVASTEAPAKNSAAATSEESEH